MPEIELTRQSEELANFSDLQRYRHNNVTKRLNDIYAEQPSSLDPVLQDVQAASSVVREKW
jgi:hypothetical protein